MMNTRRVGGKPVIGILGGVGSGKSTAAAEFAALGCRLVDADRIGHELLTEPDVLAEVRRRWGDGVLGPDAKVSRAALAEVVFRSPAELEALNAILQPRIRRRMESAIAEAQADESAKAVVLDAAVLLEAGWDDLCTHLVFISAPALDRRRRVAESRHWSGEVWEAREKSQISLDKKASRCDYTLDNRLGASFLREQVRVIFHRIGQED
jgi:dephospho-CoA kinase